jgi:hypothetical protein
MPNIVDPTLVENFRAAICTVKFSEGKADVEADRLNALKWDHPNFVHMLSGKVLSRGARFLTKGN